MKLTLLLTALLGLCLCACRAEDTNDAPKLAETTNAPAADTNKPIVLESFKAAKPQQPPQRPKIPVYVIPECYVVMTPMGPITFAKEHHLQELAKLFPTRVATNIVLYDH